MASEIDTCICIDVRNAANQLTRLYDEAIREAGISITQFSLIHSILTLKEPTLNRLSEATQLDRSTLGRNVRVLENVGLVSINPGIDARTRVIGVTRKGKNAFKKAAPLWINIQADMQAKLGTSQLLQMKQSLSALTN